MRNMFKTTLGMLVGLSLLALPAVSQAQEHPLTLKLDPGVAFPLTHPQTDRFNVGGALQVTPLIGVTPWLAVGPTVSVLALPSKLNGTDTGTIWGVGLAGTVRRPHDESNTGHGWSAVSPWVSGEAQFVRTGPLDRASLSLAVGASVPTSASRTLWVGPFARYQDVVESLNPRSGFDTSDAHVLILGVSFEFGAAAKTKPVQEVEAAPLSDRDHDGTPDVRDRCPDVPGPKENQGCPWPTVEKPAEKKPAAQAPVEIKQIVYFAWDSTVVRPSENPQLSAVVKTLLANVDYTATIEGHASSEGQVAHNQKLSQKRAEAVLDYLVKAGVERERLTAVGYGSTRPVADNATQAGRVLNRRVEFVVKFVFVNGAAK